MAGPARETRTDFRIEPYTFGQEQVDAQIGKLLSDVFVGEGYTPGNAGHSFAAPSLQRRGKLWIATSGEHVVGTVFLVDSLNPFRQIVVGDEVEVHLLAVARSHRRAGVGRALLDALLAGAQSFDAMSIVLSTQPTMGAAHKLYLETGFHRAPERDWKRPDGREYWVFTKSLQTPRDSWRAT